MDNVGYDDLGCYGNLDAITPRIDRLASDGVRCLDFYNALAYVEPAKQSMYSTSAK